MKAQPNTERVCFCCGLSDSQPIASIEYAFYDKSPLLSSISLVFCKHCGAVYYNSIMQAENYAQYYAEQHKYNTSTAPGTGILTEHEKKRFIRISELVSKHQQDYTGYTVDIGCAKGGMLRVFREEGRYTLVGIDPSLSNIELLNAEGFTAYCTTVDALPLPDASCSTIILSHVLEHVFDTKKALAEIHRCLKHDGIVYVETPNAACYPANANAPVMDFAHEHINHFDTITLINCLKATGFNCLETGSQYLPNGCGGDMSLYGVFCKQAKFSYQKLQLQKTHLSVRMKQLFEKHKSIVAIFLDIASRHSDIYVWGLSSYMLLLITELHSKKKFVTGYFDENSFKQQQTLHGLPIRHPKHIAELPSTAMLFLPSGPYQLEMQNYLDSQNFAGTFAIV